MKTIHPISGIYDKYFIVHSKYSAIRIIWYSSCVNEKLFLFIKESVKDSKDQFCLYPEVVSTVFVSYLYTKKYEGNSTISCKHTSSTGGSL